MHRSGPGPRMRRYFKPPRGPAERQHYLNGSPLLVDFFGPPGRAGGQLSNEDRSSCAFLALTARQKFQVAQSRLVLVVAGILQAQQVGHLHSQFISSFLIRLHAHIFATSVSSYGHNRPSKEGLSVIPKECMSLMFFAGRITPSNAGFTAPLVASFQCLAPRQPENHSSDHL